MNDQFFEKLREDHHHTSASLNEVRASLSQLASTVSKLEGMINARFDAIEKRFDSVDKEIRELKDADNRLHTRISEKDDEWSHNYKELEGRIRAVETRENASENRLTAIETSQKNSKWWIAGGFSVTIGVATILATIFGPLLGKFFG